MPNMKSTSDGRAFRVDMLFMLEAGVGPRTRGGEGHVGEEGGAKYENVPNRACSRVRCEGWGQEGVEHKKHTLEGVFCVLDVKGGLLGAFLCST